MNLNGFEKIPVRGQFFNFHETYLDLLNSCDVAITVPRIFNLPYDVSDKKYKKLPFR